MKHGELKIFGVQFDAGDQWSLWRATDAIVAAGGLLLSASHNMGYAAAYAAERSLEPEIRAAIGGKPGERVS